MRIVRAGEGKVAIEVANRRVPLPSSRPARIALAIGLMAGGLVGFLPVVGFWMLPCGLLVLAVDYPPAKRLAQSLLARLRLLRRRMRAFRSGA